jgi:hypothetical protein
MMNILATFLCLVLSVAVAGCSTSGTDKLPLTKTGYELGLQRMRQDSSFYSKQFNTCLVKGKRAPAMPMWASLLRVSVQDAPRVYCKKLFKAYLGGRVPYKDFKEASADRVTQKWMRIIVEH